MRRRRGGEGGDGRCSAAAAAPRTGGPRSGGGAQRGTARRPAETPPNTPAPARWPPRCCAGSPSGCSCPCAWLPVRPSVRLSVPPAPGRGSAALGMLRFPPRRLLPNCFIFATNFPSPFPNPVFIPYTAAAIPCAGGRGFCCRDGRAGAGGLPAAAPLPFAAVLRNSQIPKFAELCGGELVALFIYYYYYFVYSLKFQFVKAPYLAGGWPKQGLFLDVEPRCPAVGGYANIINPCPPRNSKIQLQIKHRLLARSAGR